MDFWFVDLQTKLKRCSRVLATFTYSEGCCCLFRILCSIYELTLHQSACYYFVIYIYFVIITIPMPMQWNEHISLLWWNWWQHWWVFCRSRVSVDLWPFQPGISTSRVSSELPLFLSFSVTIFSLSLVFRCQWDVGWPVCISWLLPVWNRRSFGKFLITHCYLDFGLFYALRKKTFQRDNYVVHAECLIHHTHIVNPASFSALLELYNAFTRRDVQMLPTAHK